MMTFTCRSTFLYGCVAGRGEITDQHVSISDPLSRNWTLGAFAWTQKWGDDALMMSGESQ
jgi:hypothetical protein